MDYGLFNVRTGIDVLCLLDEWYFEQASSFQVY